MRQTGWIRLSAVGLVLIFLTSGMASASVVAVRSTAQGSPVRPSTVAGTSSDNWAGYVGTSSNGTWSSVNATWTIPKYHGGCPLLALHITAVFWVGLDGGSSSSHTVEQTGTGMECRFGSITYFPWFEFYPNPMRFWSIAVHPGDNVTGDVRYINGTYNLTLVDHTTQVYGWAYRSFASAQRSTVEWVAERPSYAGSWGRLPNFGTVTFRDCYSTQWGNTTKIGLTTSLSTMRMESDSGLRTLAQPTGLNGSYHGFEVRWAAPGP